MSTPFTLSQLGWHNFFQQQISLDEWDNFIAARVVAQHRNRLEVMGESGRRTVEINPQLDPLTVGDWVLLDDTDKPTRLLERQSLFSRKAVGSKLGTQLVAANVDTVFIVCSLNHDFNLNRIERFLALAKEAEVEALVVLSKADLCDDPESFVHAVQKLDPLMVVEAVNTLDPECLQGLKAWCSEGKTVAFMGSSGVGKSTLVNGLLGDEAQLTQGVREDDSKGRHTTTGRSLHLMPSGGWLMDTPGMRELQLSDCESGVTATFQDITELALNCQFGDCQHMEEPGCAVKQAIEEDELDERRLKNFHKLLREQAFNGASIAEKRAKYRQFGRQIRSAVKVKKQHSH